jgi:hypothetical protein
MNLPPHTVQSNVGTSRPILFLSAWLLGNRPPSMGILLCGPGENADGVSGQPPFGSTHSPNENDNKPPGTSAGDTFSI